MKLDSRFFPGHTWVFDSDPMIGLCIEGTPEKASKTYLDDASFYDPRDHCYTLTAADAQPVLWERATVKGGRP